MAGWWVAEHMGSHQNISGKPRQALLTLKTREILALTDCILGLPTLLAPFSSHSIYQCGGGVFFDSVAEGWKAIIAIFGHVMRRKCTGSDSPFYLWTRWKLPIIDLGASPASCSHLSGDQYIEAPPARYSPAQQVWSDFCSAWYIRIIFGLSKSHCIGFISY